MHLLSPTTAIAVAAVTIGVGACGNGDDDTIPLADYQGRVAEICTASIGTMNAELVPAIEAGVGELTGTEPFDPAELAMFYESLIEPTDESGEQIDEMLKTLRALPPPDERADDFEQQWSDIETTLNKSRADIADAAADPEAATELWDLEVSPFTPIDARAAELGVPECALDT